MQCSMKVHFQEYLSLNAIQQSTITRIEKYNRVIGCILWRNTREKFLKRRRNSRESWKMRSARDGSDRQNDSRSIYTEIKHPFELLGSRMESRKAQINAIRSLVARECRREHRRDGSSVTAVGNCIRFYWNYDSQFRLTLNYLHVILDNYSCLRRRVPFSFFS